MDPVQSELKNAKLTALQNQIVPHYIVNSMDAIRMKLLIDGQEDSAELLRCLETSLKTYGFSPADTVTVSQELAFLEDTLKLHNFRFLGKLTWTVSIEPQTKNLQIPRFLLQPILENSLSHGLNGDMEAPSLQIKIWLQEDALCLSVSDNGCGYSDRKDFCGIGLSNVTERLRLLYGNNFQMQIQSEPGSGTCVTLRLPGKGSAYL